MWGKARPHNSILLPQSVRNISFLRQSWQFVWSLTGSWVESSYPSRIIQSYIYIYTHTHLCFYPNCILLSTNLFNREATLVHVPLFLSLENENFHRSRTFSSSLFTFSFSRSALELLLLIRDSDTRMENKSRGGLNRPTVRIGGPRVVTRLLQ